MKLKTFDRTNVTSSKHTTATVRLTKSKNYINHNGVLMIDLKAGDSVSLSQDEEDPKNWYISKSKKGFGLSGNRKDRGLYFCCSNLVRQIQEVLDNYGETKFRIGTEYENINNTKHYPLFLLKQQDNEVIK